MADDSKPADAVTATVPEPKGEVTSAAIPSIAGSDIALILDKHGYRTAPDQKTTGWPPGIPFIVGNEACERFSYYGMRAILFVHLVALYTAAGEIEGRANELARSTMHLFFAGVYALPMLGAIISDRLAGKFRTILYISLFYCAGHAVLSGWERSLSGIYLGLALIAFGAGGIKPCVSANVGDQFGKGNWFRVRTVFQIFYFSINFGSFFAISSIPRIKAYSGPYLASLLSGWRTFSAEEQEHLGTSVAFAIPGILMFLATLVFWLGRGRFVHVPPKPGGKFGLLDTISSVALFLTFGHLFFTAGRPWWELLAYSAVSLTVGLAVFAYRQSLAQDDGFLAIVLYSLKRFFFGGKDSSPSREPEEKSSWTFGIVEQSRVDSVTGPAIAKDHVPESREPLARSRFWGAAVQRFGVEATEGPIAVLKIISILLFISVFWALFDQHASSWIEQARLMDLNFLGAQVLPNEIQALNPLLVMALIPILNLVYFGCDRLGIQTPTLARMTVGMLLTAFSFVAAALIQSRIDTVGPGQVWFVWQIVPYVLLTIGEVMVSITALEFAYTQAPKRMKSTIMSFLNLTVTLGNVLVALLAYFSGLKLVNFFWLFAGLMAAAALLFGIRSLFYVQRDYPQE
jgi:proton-dependent oligopeptide transporter, POT family